MLGQVRGAAEKSRRSDSNASTTARPTPSHASHALGSRSTAHSSTNGSRNGHAAHGISSKSTSLSANSASAAAEHALHGKKHSSAYPHVDTIEEEYQSSGRRKEEARRHHHTNGVTNGNNHSTSNSNSNSSSFSRTEGTSAGRAGSGRVENGGNSSTSTADANFRTGMKLVQQAYEEKYQALVEEVNTWKWISEEQSAQMTVLAAELARVEGNYAALQKEMAQLEMFRKAIVSMVDQHSGVSLTQLEQSILETIGADAENGDTGYDVVADADTSSFMLDDEPDHLSPLSNQPRFGRENVFSRDGKSESIASTSILGSLKTSTNSTVSRPRASTESIQRSGSTQQSTRHPMASSGLSPSRQNNTLAPRAGNGILSDSSPNGAKKLQKSDSVDSLRSKRNTISTSSRPLYPNTSLSASTTAKRHSSISPLSPRARAIIASSRTAPASNSFSTNSTPNTSPRQPTSGAPSSSIVRSASSKDARQQQQQQQKEKDASSTLQPKASNTDISQTARRSQRSGSESLSNSGLSPAAMKLLRQQEKQQNLEEEKDQPHKGSGHTRHGSRQHHTDDEDYRRSMAHAQGRSSANGGSRAHQRNVSESGHESNVHSHVSEYESSSKHQRDDLQQRQNGSYGDKSQTHAASASNETRPQQSNGGVDASAFTMLYKEIRDSMDVSSFGMFARAVVTSFNEGEKTTDETLDEVGKIVKDRALNQRFRDLIHQAIADKENQVENGNGNETMEGDITLEIDHSLLLDDELDLDRGHEQTHSSFSRTDNHVGEHSMQEGDESLFQDQLDDAEADQSLLDRVEQEESVTARGNLTHGGEGREANGDGEASGAHQKSMRKKTL
ncbi:hypothetical protein BGZ98_002708 [Dissophora globulifera]|nr:hypothetical protein BGZ98_002708 [Dissophora globulifera]